MEIWAGINAPAGRQKDQGIGMHPSVSYMWMCGACMHGWCVCGYARVSL